jgi:hypothetical protein
VESSKISRRAAENDFENEFQFQVLRIALASRRRQSATSQPQAIRITMPEYRFEWYFLAGKG